MIDMFLPATVKRCARRLSTILITLALLVLFLFPATARAGTEVPLDRWVTGGLLAASGLALRVLPAHTFVVLMLHGALQLFLGATWAAVLSAGGVGYATLSLLRMRSGPAAVAVADHPDLKLSGIEIVRENVESIAMALLIALTCREFLYEAFLIPTASMKPTILGQNLREGRKHGDRLLASKVPLLFGDPPRWSIVVFKYPLYRRVNYIKRLVGLPGEHMELRDGDVYIDGACVAKPEPVQDQLWFPEYPPAGQATPLSRTLAPADENADWDLRESSATADVPAGAQSRVYYDETLARTDSDLRVGVDVDVSRSDEDGRVLLRVEGASRRVDLAIGHEGAWLTAPGIGGRTLPGVMLPRRACRVALGVADRMIRVWVDGSLVARVPHADEKNGGARMPRVAIGLSGIAATFSGLRVMRDLQYGRSRAWDIPDDGFIMLGDNTGRSKDSRLWDVNRVTTADGRVYEGESEVKLEDNSSVRFRTSDDGMFYEFIDVDGIFRRVPTEGSTIDRGVRRPFVRRRDLVGRAFLTFFPFPPFGDLRLHFLP